MAAKSTSSRCLLVVFGLGVMMFMGSLYVTNNNPASGHVAGELVNYRNELKDDDDDIVADALHYPAPCGEICSYGGTIVSQNEVGYPRLEKELNCSNIMRRMAYIHHSIPYPPPMRPPANMLEEFTMYGKMPIRETKYFKDEWSNATKRTFNSEYIMGIIEQVKRGGEANTYTNSGPCVEDTLKKHATRIQGGHGVVIGTMVPWLESILLANGADRVTTLEYGVLTLKHPQLDVYNPYAYAENYLGGEMEMFDFGASFSSLEHSGLGRYGDPLNPYGDLEAMAQVWCMIKPGGMFLVGVPYNKVSSYIKWNAGRRYSSERLQHLTANWIAEELVECIGFSHAVVLLRKPEM